MPFHTEALVRDFLLDNFLDSAATELEMDVELRFPNESVFFDIRNGTLTFPDVKEAELILYFESSAQAQRLFAGREDMVTAFMRGQICSNGHLIWVFQMFAAFGKHAASA